MTDTDTLRATLDDLLRSGTTSNPALNRLLDDYTRFHLVLVAVGSLFMLGFVVLTVLSWRGFRRDEHKRSAVDIRESARSSRSCPGFRCAHRHRDRSEC